MQIAINILESELKEQIYRLGCLEKTNNEPSRIKECKAAISSVQAAISKLSLPDEVRNCNMSGDEIEQLCKDCLGSVFDLKSFKEGEVFDGIRIPDWRQDEIKKEALIKLKAK